MNYHAISAIVLFSILTIIAIKISYCNAFLNKQPTRMELFAVIYLVGILNMVTTMHK